MGITADPLLVLRFPPPLTMTQAQFYDFCVANPEVKMELTSRGEVVIVPSGWNSGKKNAVVVNRLTNWAFERDLGDVVGPDVGFDLPNGATRSPDAAFVRKERLGSIPADRLDRFLPLSPDFVVAVRSASDRLRDQLARMSEYMENGVRLAWLIDPFELKIHIYRPGQNPIVLDHPATVSAEPELPGFILDLASIWA